MQAGRARDGRLALAYLAVAATAFVAAAVVLPSLAGELAGHYYHPRVLALTHTVTLGWITLTIMGASYQLVPVLLERPVWSERLARWQLGAATVGTAGIVAHFFVAEWRGLVWAAGVVALVVAAHVLNIAMTLRGLRMWTFTTIMIVVALVGLGLTTVAGVALGLDHVIPFVPWDFFPRLHAHVHLALLGWVLPMIVAVGARVYPMFLLAPPPAARSLRIQAAGVVTGAPLVVAGLVSGTSLVAVGAIVVGIAVAAHLASVVAMLRTRRRRTLDWGLVFVVTGSAFLVPATAVGLGFAFDLFAGSRLAVTYATLIVGGWVSLTIAGMMLKIVPFLVWYVAYGDRVGRQPVPMVAELCPAAGEGTAYGLLTLGMVGLSGAVFAGSAALIRLAALVVAAGAVVFAATLARVLMHLAPATVAGATAPGSLRRRRARGP